MRYQFIQDHCPLWPVSVQCSVLAVTRSGYYAWKRRVPGPRARRREALTQQIQEAHEQARRTYGAPRIHRELVAQGTACNRKTVARCMRLAGIRAKTVRRFRVSTTDSNHAHPVAENIVNRDFQAERPCQKWLADITYVPTREGWLYLAVVEDLFSRKIVGWSMSERIDSRLVVNALQMALKRESHPQTLIVHSDRGVQYACDHYQRLLKKHGIVCSMSRKANCWDNAPMESFMATLKKELVHHEDYQTREQARRSLFEYIEVFYNRNRRHSALGYLSPQQFELVA